MSGLGQIQNLDLREVSTHEATDSTPWLCLRSLSPRVSISSGYISRMVSPVAST